MRIIFDHEDGNWQLEVGDIITLRVKGIETQNGRIVELRAWGTTATDRRRETELYVAWSSVDGKLDVLSVHRQPYFVIYEHGTNHRVRCSFPDEWLDNVKSYLRHRVVAEGLIHYDSAGVPTTLSRPTALVPVPESEQPDITAYRGVLPGITGGLSSYEYVRQMRSGDENG